MVGEARPLSGRLAVEVTSFIGRRHELAEVKRLLSDGRLVTLIGVGGSGKTRLALRVAAETRRAYTCGVWQVDLGPLTDGALLGHAVADALDLPDQVGHRPEQAVIEYLRDRQVLLILDGCEHLRAACAAFAGDLLRGTDRVRVLCTSRQPLHVAGELVFAVPPLAVPDPERPPPPDAAARYPALRLFVARAAAAAPGFTLTPANQPAVARICAALDGLPLAIELAAAQLRMRSVEQVEAGLADRFRLLSTRHATPARHRTLEATFDWSYALCSPAEQGLWRRLAVFTDGFDDDAVGYVCASGSPPLDVISGLVDKSVLLRTGPGRYQLLDTVREYGLARLRDHAGTGAGDDELVLRRRHRDHYLRLAEQAEADWFGADQEYTYHRIRAEHANLQSALDFCLTTPGEAETGLTLAGTLWFFWAACGYQAEGRHWLERGLAVRTPGGAGPAGSGPAARKAAWALASILVAQGELARARALATRCIADAERAGDGYLVAASLQVRATAALWSDESDRARAVFAEAAARFAALGVVNSNVLMNRAELALTMVMHGELDAAEQMCHQVRDDCVEHGERWGLAWALHVLAVIAGTRGDLAEATGYARECLAIHQAFHNLTGIALVVELLASLDGSPHRTAALHGIADRLWQVLGRRMFGSAYLDAVHREAAGRARHALGDEGYDEGFRFGAGLALDEAVEYGLHDEPAAPWTPGEPELLTPREREVAELLAEGLSNREIAARLVTSQRTAETHVQNILRKLGFTTRAQIADWAADRP
jgi:predicted ATPase/DNA-binding CsgD family transcriptional regulator